MAADPKRIVLPPELLPSDGRFGSGPSKVRVEAVAALASRAEDYLGTSHRQATVKSVVGRARAGLAELFSLPDGYEILLGNGGATSFWGAATLGLVDARTQHPVCGEVSPKFAPAPKAAPLPAPPQVDRSPPPTPPP